MTRTQIKKKYGYDKVGSFSKNNIALVKLKDKWGHVDIDGKIVTPIIYDWTGDFDKEAFVMMKNIYGYVDKNGILEEEFRRPFIKAVFND